MTKIIEFKISPDGSKVEIDAEGFVGGECEDVTKDVMKALGEVQDKKRKPEFFKSTHGGVNIGA